MADKRQGIVGLTIIVALVTLVTAPVLAQSMAGSRPVIKPNTWQEAEQTASKMVMGRTAQGVPLVTQSQMYDPDARVIHDSDEAFEYPVAMDESVWRGRLSTEQYRVLRQEATERPFTGPLNNNKRQGTYFSAATGQPLFRSEDKYDSGTGWPSFTKPIAPDAVVYIWDGGLFSRRIEVVDSLSGSHLGHVFDDGPTPTGQRYCMNSAALVFVPDGEAPPELLIAAEE